MKGTTLNYLSSKYKAFEVHYIEDNYSFFHIQIKNESLFFKGLCEFVLNEDYLLRYARNKSGITFQPNKSNYISLFRELYNFIDDENLDLVEIDDFDLNDVLVDEYNKIEEKNGKKFIRLNKIGRIGEYIFHIFLSDYFNFNCIIPKVKLTTDRNMSVYGIDALFLDRKNKMILFGESKVSNRIENGISLVNRSLKDYEREIREEYTLVLSNNHLKLNGLDELFPGQTEVCMTFDDFLIETNTKNIGVPIFIAHGEEVDYKVILNRLQNKIKRYKFFGLNTIYYVISLPIIDKKKFFSHLTKTISEKLEDYNGAANNKR